MKKQMKKSLFTVAVGCSLFGAMLMSATTKPAASTANQPQDLQEQPVSTPTTASVAEESPKIPFTFYLTLVTTFTNGGSIDFNAMNGEEQSFIWDKITNWRKGQ